jgi:hypothetical protein
MGFLLPPKSGSGRQIEMWTQLVSSYINQLIAKANTRTGTADPTATVTPNYLGEIYLDTSAHKVYISDGLTNTSWLVLN